MKLTDTQLVLLSAAAQRQDGAVEIDPKLKGSASRKVLSKLLSEHLIEEIPAQGTPAGLAPRRGQRSACATHHRARARSKPAALQLVDAAEHQVAFGAAVVA